MSARRPSPADPAARRLPLGAAGSLGVVALAALLGCATASKPETGNAGDPPRASGARGVPLDQRPLLEGYWDLYRRQDPAWPAARVKWLALGDAARRSLIAGLIRELVVGTNGMRMERVDRAATELVRIGVEALPDLLETGHAGDGILRQQVAEILVFIGRPGVDAVVGDLEGAGAGPFRRHEVEVLGRVGDVRAFETVRRILREDRDWGTRAAAAAALAGLGDDRAVGDLEAALRRERDPYVLEGIIQALGSFPEARSVPALIDAMERGRRRDPVEGLRVVRACGRSLQRITGQQLPNDPRAWRQWWARSGGRERDTRRDH